MISSFFSVGFEEPFPMDFKKQSVNPLFHTPQFGASLRHWVTVFRRSEVNGFFDILKQGYETEKSDPRCIFNVDETDMSTVQQQKQKIIAQTGNKQIGKKLYPWRKRRSLQSCVLVLVVVLCCPC